MVDNNRKQDGPSLESSVYLSMTFRYLCPWDPGSLGPLDLGTLVPPPSSYLFSYSPPLVWFGMVRYGGGSQMTSEFIHEEISMDYNGLSCTIRGVMTGMDDWDG